MEACAYSKAALEKRFGKNVDGLFRYIHETSPDAWATIFALQTGFLPE
jgi:hypothetical protein